MQAQNTINNHMTQVKAGWSACAGHSVLCFLRVKEQGAVLQEAIFLTNIAKVAVNFAKLADVAILL